MDSAQKTPLDADFCSQGFRKYLTQSKDHEELLSFLLGGLIKDKARMHQAQRHEQPEKVVVKLAELEEKVTLIYIC
jgi:DNA replication licensing factor MCM2